MIKIKKACLILILIILIVTPLAFAEDGKRYTDSNSNRDKVGISNDDNELNDNSDVGEKDDLKESNKDDESRLRNKVKPREINDNLIDEAKKRYEKARENFQEAKVRYQERKQEFSNASGDDKRIKAGNFLGVSINVLGEHLNKLRSQVESNTNLDEETAQKMLSEIDDAINKLNNLKIKIENAQTKDEIKQDAKELRQIWIDLKYRLKLQSQQIVNSKLANLIEKIESLQKKLDKALQSNITVNQEKLNSFNSKLEEARSKFDQAQQLITNADKNMTEENIGNINKLNAESRESLKEANNILKDILAEIKLQNKAFNLNEVENE